MTENLIYKYPGDGDLSYFKSEISANYEKRRTLTRKSLIVGAAVIIVFGLLSLLFKFTDLYIFLMVIYAFFSLLFLKGAFANGETTALAIEAKDEKMKLTYFNKSDVTECEIYYEDITFARFSDDDYTSFQIAFSHNCGSYYKKFDVQGNEKEVLNPNLFLFRINPESFEQFFFLYVAEELFMIRKFQKTKKFFKKYGNKQEYLERISESEE
jgi:hypothetical protein